MAEARIHFIVARKSPVAVVFRRGPKGDAWGGGGLFESDPMRLARDGWTRVDNGSKAIEHPFPLSAPSW